MKKILTITCMIISMVTFSSCNVSGFKDKILEALSKGVENNMSASQSEATSSEHEHEWIEGLCNICGEPEPTEEGDGEIQDAPNVENGDENNADAE